MKYFQFRDIDSEQSASKTKKHTLSWTEFSALNLNILFINGGDKSL